MDCQNCGLSMIDEYSFHILVYSRLFYLMSSHANSNWILDQRAFEYAKLESSYIEWNQSIIKELIDIQIMHS